MHKEGNERKKKGCGAKPMHWRSTSLSPAGCQRTSSIPTTKAFPYKPFFDANVESRIRQLPSMDDDTEPAMLADIDHNNGAARGRRRPAGVLPSYTPEWL